MKLKILQGRTVRLSNTVQLTGVAENFNLSKYAPLSFCKDSDRFPMTSNTSAGAKILLQGFPQTEGILKKVADPLWGGIIIVLVDKLGKTVLIPFKIKSVYHRIELGQNLAFPIGAPTFTVGINPESVMQFNPSGGSIFPHNVEEYPSAVSKHLVNKAVRNMFLEDGSFIDNQARLFSNPGFITRGRQFQDGEMSMISTTTEMTVNNRQPNAAISAQRLIDIPNHYLSIYSLLSQYTGAVHTSTSLVYTQWEVDIDDVLIAGGYASNSEIYVLSAASAPDFWNVEAQNYFDAPSFNFVHKGLLSGASVVPVSGDVDLIYQNIKTVPAGSFRTYVHASTFPTITTFSGLAGLANMTTNSPFLGIGVNVLDTNGVI